MHPVFKKHLRPKPKPNTLHEKFKLPQIFDEELLDYSKIENYPSMLTELEFLDNQFKWMFDYSKNCFYFLTANTELFPKRELAFVPGQGYRCLIDNTHPADVPYMLDIQSKAYNFLCEQKIEDRLTFKFIFKIRMLTKSGDYVPFNFQVKAIALDITGNIWISLAHGKLSQTEKPYQPLMISTIDKSQIHQTHINHPNMPYFVPKLTKKETTVLLFLSRHISTLEICETLKFSINTLKIHKKSLLLKLNAQNIQIAIENARLLGLLKE